MFYGFANKSQNLTSNTSKCAKEKHFTSPKKEKQDSIHSIEEGSVSRQNSDNSSKPTVEVKSLVNKIDEAIINIKVELDELERRQQKVDLF